MATVLDTKTCPQCGAAMPVLPGFTSWCDICGWNLEPLKKQAPRLSRLQQLLAKLGERASDGLQREFMSADGLRPRVTASKAAAMTLAVGVHLVSLLALVGGILLIVSGNILAIILGVVLVGVAWISRPRFGRVPRDVVSPDQMPALNELATEVSRAVGTRPPDVLRITGEYNASVAQLGLRRVRLLTVGLPLFAVLDGPERVALLGHEFGHFANGDPRRGIVVGSAIDALFEWHKLLVPDTLLDTENGLPGLLMLPFNVLMLVVSQIPLALARLLFTLLYRESQRAEYLADAHAARVAGTEALVSAWDKFNLGGAVSHATMATTDEHWLNRSLWDELRSLSAAYPEREIERARRLDRSKSGRLDLTHPPTSSRIEVVRARSSLNAPLQISAEQSDALDRELAAAMPRVQGQLIDAYRDSLHRGATWEETEEMFG